MFYKEILEQTEPGNPFLEYLKKQTFEISPLGTYNSGAFVGLMCVPVCPKNSGSPLPLLLTSSKLQPALLKQPLKAQKD